MITFAAVNGVLLLIDLVTPGSWWVLWPVLGWGLVVAAHWLYVKSVTVDEAWADRRTEDLRLQAYDRGHIEDIAKRYPPGKAPDSAGEMPRD